MARQDGKLDNFGDSYYQQCLDNSIIRRLKPLLSQAGYKLRDSDGRIVMDLELAWHTPWHHIYHDAFLDCHTWHRVMFDFISRELPAGRSFVPSSCQNCWKVVIRPKTLKAQFALVDIQKRMNRPCKLGMETRDAVHGLYGGYFYNHSLPEGLQRYNDVRKMIENDPAFQDDMARAEYKGNPAVARFCFDPDRDILLKRACTEYEMLCGPSDDWTVTDEQIKLETLVNKWVVRDHLLRSQPDHAIAEVHANWIDWAWAYGDPTVLEFTGNKPLFRKYVTYHHIRKMTKKQREEEFEKFHRKYYYNYDL